MDYFWWGNYVTGGDYSTVTVYIKCGYLSVIFIFQNTAENK